MLRKILVFLTNIFYMVYYMYNIILVKKNKFEFFFSKKILLHCIYAIWCIPSILYDMVWYQPPPYSMIDVASCMVVLMSNKQDWYYSYFEIEDAAFTAVRSERSNPRVSLCALSGASSRKWAKRLFPQTRFSRVAFHFWKVWPGSFKLY